MQQKSTKKIIHHINNHLYSIDNSSASARAPLAPPPPHPLDMLYSQHNRQQQQNQNKHHHNIEKPNQCKSSGVSSLFNKSYNGSSPSFTTATALRTTTTQQLAAAAAESAAAYYTAAAAAAATMLNPALNAASAAVNPFANPLDWLGACTGQKQRSSSSSSPSSSLLKNSSARAIQKDCSIPSVVSAADLMTMFSMNAYSSIPNIQAHITAEASAGTTIGTNQRSLSNTSASSMASSSSSAQTHNSHHKNTTHSAVSSNVASPISTSGAPSALAAHTAAASAFFGSVAPFSTPSLVNPYPHLASVSAAHGAHSLPSPTIYPPTPPPSAPWVHPWYAVNCNQIKIKLKTIRFQKFCNTSIHIDIIFACSSPFSLIWPYFSMFLWDINQATGFLVF